jgi:hypothetical protein
LNDQGGIGILINLAILVMVLIECGLVDLKIAGARIITFTTLVKTVK